VTQRAKKVSVEQSADDGDVTIAKLAGGDLQVSDGATSAMLTARPSLEVELLDGSAANLVVDLDSSLEADLRVELGGGARTVTFTGDDNFVGRDLRIEGGAGPQTIALGGASGLGVGRHLAIDLGGDADAADDGGQPVLVVGDVKLHGVNLFEVRNFLFVFGRLDASLKAEAGDGTFDVAADLYVGKAFKYVGSSGADRVLLRGTTVVFVEGPATIDLRDGFTTSGLGQELELDEASIVGRLTVKSGDSTNGDVVRTSATTSVEGALLVDLAEGENEASLLGEFLGTSAKYFGGAGRDDVTYGMGEGPGRLRVKLEDGDDVFTLGAGAVLDSLWVDFGEGTDVFVNELGVLPFPTTLRNLP
jgi:hypothetical protein